MRLKNHPKKWRLGLSKPVKTAVYSVKRTFHPFYSGGIITTCG